MKKSKSVRTAYAAIGEDTTHSTAEAVKLMVKHSKVKFDATAEIHFNLGIDPKHADQQIRTTTSLPHGTGKKVRVVAICSDDKEAAAKKAGAAEVGGVELIEKIAGGYTDFEAVVATPDMMKNLAKAARVLGPKGLMPNPKTGTVTPDIEKAIKELVAGRMEIRNDKFGIVHSIFGKLSFGEAKLTENLDALIAAVKNMKPSGVKGTYLKSITINSTMGAGIKLNLGGGEEA